MGTHCRCPGSSAHCPARGAPVLGALSACRSPPHAPPTALLPLGVLASLWPPRLRPLPMLHAQPPLAGSRLRLLGSAQTLWGKNEGFWCPLLPSGWVLEALPPGACAASAGPQALAATSLLGPCSSGGGLWHPDGGAVAQSHPLVRRTDGQTDVPLSGCPLLPAVPGAAALPPEQAGQVPDHPVGAGASRLH